MGLVLHAQPVTHIVASVVAEEGSHGKWIVHDYFSCQEMQDEVNFLQDKTEIYRSDQVKGKVI